MTRQTPHLTLSLDTSTKLQAIGLLEDDLILERRVRRVRYNHGSSLLTAVDGLLSAHGKTVADLSLIGIGMGPGSFTGLRVGMATAKGIARAAGVPIQGASTLASFALAPAHQAVQLRVDEVDVPIVAHETRPLLAPRRRLLHGSLFFRVLNFVSISHPKFGAQNLRPQIWRPKLLGPKFLGLSSGFPRKFRGLVLGYS